MTLPSVAMAVLAVLALAFSLLALATPVRADHVEGSTVWLNQDLGEGVSSDDPGEFAGSDEECADVEEGTVLFHFVANQLAEGTTSGALTATFEGMADVTVDGYFPSGKVGPTLHFDVELSASATLTGASATFNVAQTEDTNLLLSHVCDMTGSEEEGNGTVEVEKFFCPTDGETRTEFDVFGPAEPQAGIQSESDEHDGCSIGAGVTFTIWQEDMLVTTVVTNADGIVEFDLPAGDYLIKEEASGATAGFSVGEGQVTAIVVVNYVADEEGPGLLEVEKFFCPTDGETRTEFDVFGPATPQSRTSGETAGDMEDCTTGSDVSFTLYSVGDEWVWVADLVTDENGMIEMELAPGDYALCEDASEECVEFAIGEGQVTAIVVVNYVAAPQGQIKVLKYFCDAEEDSVEFFLEGQAPNLENCDPGDAEFTLDGGEAFSTEGGIAVVWADEGTHTLAEVDTGASVELEVVADEITTVIVLNNQGAEEEQGQLKVLKYFCEAEADDTAFYPEGEAPNLEDCEPGDALFTVDEGEAFSTDDGVAVVNLDAGSGYLLTEVESEASTSFDIAAGEITTLIVLNMVESEAAGGGEGNQGDSQTEGDVQAGQGGPGTLPDTAVGRPANGSPAPLLALLAVAGLGAIGARNLQAVRRRLR